MLEFNGIKLVGDCMAITANGLKLKTVNVTTRGEFEELHQITVKQAKKLAIKVGDKIEVLGCLDVKETPEGKRTFLTADPANVAKSDDEYINVARLIGKTAVAIRYWGTSQDGRRPMANMLVAVKQKLYRGVLFDALATTFSRNCKRQSTVQVQGSLRHREYVDRGVQGKMLEIVCDPDYTAIIESAETNDPFASHPAMQETSAKFTKTTKTTKTKDDDIPF